MQIRSSLLGLCDPIAAGTSRPFEDFGEVTVGPGAGMNAVEGMRDWRAGAGLCDGVIKDDEGRFQEMDGLLSSGLGMNADVGILAGVGISELHVIFSLVSCVAFKEALAIVFNIRFPARVLSRPMLDAPPIMKLSPNTRMMIMAYTWSE